MEMRCRCGNSQISVAALPRQLLTGFIKSYSHRAGALAGIGGDFVRCLQLSRQVSRGGFGWASERK